MHHHYVSINNIICKIQLLLDLCSLILLRLEYFIGVLASEGWWEAWQPSPKVIRSYSKVVRPGSCRSATALHQASSGSSTVRQDAVTRDRRYGPLTAKRSEGRRKEGQRQSWKTPRWAWSKQVRGMWYFSIQCFDTVGWATRRASGL